MVKPNTSVQDPVPVGQPDIPTLDCLKRLLEQPTDDKPSPCQLDDDNICDYILDLENMSWPQKTREIVNEDNVEETRQAMLQEPFHNIQGNIRSGRDQVGLHVPPQDFQELGDCNIVVRDNIFKSKLETLKQNHQSTYDSTKLNEGNEIFVSFLGKGADATCDVYKHVNTNKLVVHKKYYGKPREREKDILKSLAHRNLPAVYGSRLDDGHHVLCMEFCGDSLHQWKKNRPMKEAEIWLIFEQLTDVLNHLENHGVIHQDIKPGNVCINQDLVIKLIDFGSVQLAQDVVCSEGVRMTAAYIAPEMWQWLRNSDKPVSCKADVYACGLTICFLVYDDDVVPQALETRDEKVISDKMILNPSAVAKYVTRTFPLDNYSQKLKNLLLAMLNGNPDIRISASEAHEQIVTNSASVVHDNGDINCMLGIDMLDHSASVSKLTPSATTSYHSPNGVSSQENITLLSHCVEVDSDCQNGTVLTAPDTPDIITVVHPEAGDISQCHQAVMGQLILPVDSCPKIALVTPQGLVAATKMMPDRTNKKISTNRRVSKNSNLHIQLIDQTTSKDLTGAIADGFLYDGQNQDVVLTANQNAGLSLTEKPTPYPNLIQPRSIGEQRITCLSRRRNETENLDEDNKDDTKLPSLDFEEPDRQAKPATLNKLSDCLKNGSRKRPLNDLPSEYTNVPNFYMILQKKKRKEEG
ncbi:serine/threonine-protein kinase dst1-like [Ylistrum balloti]|uniref:serine/threonine-protein kinase dst1-like n=1 Tax=Ylistrum balloti TaxID=509963 RepID=UPI002905C1B2|nr:serine/threonine-protein kinase dst1-like [Ylistrum balloti]